MITTLFLLTEGEYQCRKFENGTKTIKRLHAGINKIG